VSRDIKTPDNPQGLGLDQPQIYQIKLQGRLDAGWADWFDGMEITSESQDDGPTLTLLTGVVADQAALYGLLTRVRDVGLPLISVNRVAPVESELI
jgi:hypothetical protein